MEEIFQLTGAVIFSIASAGALVIGLSSWLGKVWANRILEEEKQKFSREMAKMQRELDIYKETVLRIQSDKLQIYRTVVDVVADMLAHFDAVILKFLPNLPPEKYHDLNHRRMQVYGYLAMLAPQTVMDAHDDLIDYLFMVIHGKAQYDWANEVRPRVLKLLNHVRADIGIDKSSIEYRGKL